MNDVHRLDTPLPEAYLIPGFITASEEAYLLTKVEECGGTPLDDDGDNADGPDSPRRFKGKAAGWKEVKGRRLMYWGGSVHPKGNTLIPLPLPAFMDRASSDCRHRGAGDASFSFDIDTFSSPFRTTFVFLVGQFPHILQRVRETGAFAGSKHGPNHVR